MPPRATKPTGLTTETSTKRESPCTATKMMHELKKILRGSTKTQRKKERKLEASILLSGCTVIGAY